MRRVKIIPCLFVLSAVLCAGQVRAQEASLGSTVFGTIERSMLQIKTVVPKESSKRAYGSGFVVDPRGIVVTNYHVVADVVQHPERYQLVAQYQNQSLPVSIIGVNVVHDLAVLQVDHAFPEAVHFSTQMPAQGEDIFAVGLPEDLNLAMIKGTYNGVLSRGPYEVIHLSAPLNAGMSGGPTVNTRGEVIGVNVSRQLGAQNISFSVPQRFARTLLEAVPAEGGLDQRIEEQLCNAQDVLTSDLIGQRAALRADSHWQVPPVPGYLSCWHEQLVKEQRQIDWRIEKCTLQDRAYVSDDEYFGHYELDVTLLRNRGLSRRRFYYAHRAALGGIIENNEKRSEHNRKYTDYQCEEDRVSNSRGTAFQVSICAHKSLKYSSINDATLILTSLSGGDEEIAVRGEFSGFAMDNLKRIVRYILENTNREDTDAADRSSN
jgi:serine protease Do